MSKIVNHPTNNVKRISFDLTRFTAADNRPCGKRISVEDGKIRKESLSNNMFGGTFERITVESPAAFADLLNTGLKPCNALAYGVPRDQDDGLLTTRKRKAAGEEGVTRTRENYEWPETGGILMLDYDPAPGQPAVDKEELLEILYKICPELRSHAHIYRPSSSSCIYDENGEQIFGVTGQRIYIPVRMANDIPRAGAAIHTRSWVNGDGYVLVSKSGVLLERGPFDRIIWQPERLDYAGGAVCDSGLEQRLPAAELLGDPDSIVDSKRVTPEVTTAERKNYLRLLDEKKREIEPERKIVVKRYADEHCQEFAEKANITVERARNILSNAADRHLLAPEFILHWGEGKTISVGEILDDPNKWHHQGFLDPIEPSYQRDNYNIARANLMSGGRPFITSFAHGGLRYTLSRQPETVRLEAGEETRACIQVINILKLRDFDLYQQGAGDGCRVVRVHDGLVCKCDGEYDFLNRMSQFVRFEIFDSRRKSGDEWRQASAPKEIARYLKAMRGQLGLRTLNGVATGPYMRPDGSVESDAGYSKQDGILLYNPGGDDFSVPEGIDVEKVFEYLWHPFRLFPFGCSVDRGVFLAAILTAATRRTIGNCPGFYFSSSTPGVGKTLLADCVNYMTAGAVVPPQAWSKDEDETRKAIMSCLSSGGGGIFFDNIEGTLKSATLAMLLTHGRFQARKLGSNTMLDLPSNSLVTLTGNNVEIAGDLNRRILTCSLSPGMEHPELRRFNFDPLEMVKQRRLGMVRGALALMLAYTKSDSGRSSDKIASFGAWDDLVRQTVCWLAKEYPQFNLADPVDSLTKSRRDDPVLEKLRNVIEAIRAIFGDKPFLCKEVVRMARGGVESLNIPSDQVDELKDAITSAAYDRDSGGPTPASLGRYFRAKKERIVGGHVIRQSDENQKKWVIDSVVANITSAQQQ